MGDYNITIGNHELLERIRPLWEELNAFHVDIGKAFSSDLAERSFDTRKDELIRSAMKIHIVIASEESDVGYCISTINSDGMGEIDSLYIKEEYRCKGLGRKMVKLALQWLNDNNVQRKIVVVLEGNNAAIEFYRSLGFLPRNIELQCIE